MAPRRFTSSGRYLNALVILLAASLAAGRALTSRDYRGRALIVGGEDEDPERYPYFVSLLEQRGPDSLILGCGGTLLAPDVVLTAAHCAEAVKEVRWGIDFANTVETRRVERRVMHPKFTVIPPSIYFDWDVALLLLDEPLEAAPSVRLMVPFQGTEIDLANETLTVIGRGSELHFRDPIPWGGEIRTRGPEAIGSLQEVAITETDVDLCRQNYNQRPHYVAITDTMLCARAAGKDSCVGDSGGPMILKGSSHEEDVQVGIVSFGQECGKPKLPGVYHRISESAKWIMKTLPELTRDQRRSSKFADGAAARSNRND